MASSGTLEVVLLRDPLISHFKPAVLSVPSGLECSLHLTPLYLQQM